MHRSFTVRDMCRDRHDQEPISHVHSRKASSQPSHYPRISYVFTPEIVLKAFYPRLEFLENDLAIGLIGYLGSKIPPEWCGHDLEGLAVLMDSLGRRRKIVRRLLSMTSGASYQSFPSWRNHLEGAHRLPAAEQWPACVCVGRRGLC